MNQGRQSWQLLRWGFVLPAAGIAAAVAHMVGGVVSQIFANGWSTPPEFAVAYWVRFAMYFLPRKAAFVIAGALAAPNYRVATACALAGIAIGTSLMIHVLGQRTVGATNYQHLAAESAGAAIGVVCIVLTARRHKEQLPIANGRSEE